MESENETVALASNVRGSDVSLPIPHWVVVSVFVLCGCILAFMIWYILFQILRSKAPKRSQKAR